MIKIKVCGITNEKDALGAAAVGVDALGFVFAHSPRQVSVTQVKEICSKLPPFISTVGVFVNEEKEKVLAIAEKTGITTLQFHGDESPSYINYFKKHTSLRIIKALRIKDEKSFKEVEKYSPSAFLFDTYSPQAYGGIGQAFNWHLIENPPSPFILAGGLNPENVRDALNALWPDGVDVSSGVERDGDTGKDLYKIRNFVKEVRRWETDVKKIS